MEDEELYRLKAFLDRSKNRRKILSILSETEDGLRPKDIASKAEVSRQTISRRIGDLREEGLVKVLNPDDNRNRYYQLTEKGEELLAAYE